MTRDYFQDLSGTEGIEPERDVPQQHQSEIENVSPQPQRSIRNVTPSSRPRSSRFIAPGASPSGPQRPMQGPMDAQKTRKRTIVLWVLGFIALIGFGFAVSSIFRKTTVTVVPREYTAVFDEQITYMAYPEGASSAPTGALFYTTDTKVFEETTPVNASGTEQVSEAASGAITVYNSYSDSGVRLIKNTRFETPDGKVFRIRDSIIIPGRTSSAAGSIVTTVYADQPGTSYNIGPVERFTVPGLKGTPEMYEGVYARSTTPMSGGFVGARPAVQKAARDAAVAQLSASIEEKVQIAYAGMGEVYALGQMVDITFAPLSIENSSDGKSIAKLTASVVMPVIARDALDSFLVKETSADTEDAVVRIADPSSFSIKSQNSGKVLLLGTDNLGISVSGNAVFVWKVDSEKLAADLAGKNKAAFEAVVSGYPSIDSASAKVYPLWSQTFPSEPSGIKIVVGGGGAR